MSTAVPAGHVVTRAELERSLAELAAQVEAPAAGILGPDSIAWRLGGDLAVFLGGGRAILLQLAHPLVAYAVAHHSDTRRDVVGRFRRTFQLVFAMTFGPLDAAVAAARRVHAIHTRVRGELPAAFGAWPAGARYDANDAAALRWVHATLIDTTIAVRRRLGARLDPRVLDRYTVEMNRFAALFGIPKPLLPRSWGEHEAYMHAMLAGDALAVSPVALETAQFLFGRGGPGPQPPLGKLTERLAAAMLPRRLARAFELECSALDRAAIAAGFATLGRAYEKLPRRLVAIPAHHDARRRLAGKPPSERSAWTERFLFGLSGRVAARSPG